MAFLVDDNPKAISYSYMRNRIVKAVDLLWGPQLPKHTLAPEIDIPSCGHSSCMPSCSYLPNHLPFQPFYWQRDRLVRVGGVAQAVVLIRTAAKYLLVVGKE